MQLQSLLHGRLIRACLQTSFFVPVPPLHRDSQKRLVLEPWIRRARNTERRFFRKHGWKRPQLVVENSSLTAFPALAILRP
jgi:hypothetical protein